MHGDTTGKSPLIIRPQSTGKGFSCRLSNEFSAGSCWLGIWKSYRLADFSILLATFTPLRPFTYLAMPR